MSTRRPDWWPVFGDPVRCPIRSSHCCRRICIESGGLVCEERNALALVPIERDYSNYNAPFCHHPEKCGPQGRCLREIACND